MIDIRIDEKMVKGQLTNQWTKTMSGDTLFVVNDPVASNKLLAQSLLLTAPGSVRAVIRSLAEAEKILADPRSENMKIHVVVNNFKDAWQICQHAKVESINITLYTKGAGERRELIYGVKLTEEEIQQIRELEEKGVRVFNQPLPGIPQDDLLKLL